jgi:EAL domain-containing protein (putative c-di-GMP-specific phosphodiesterase class I)
MASLQLYITARQATNQDNSYTLKLSQAISARLMKEQFHDNLELLCDNLHINGKRLVIKIKDKEGVPVKDKVKRYNQDLVKTKVEN